MLLRKMKRQMKNGISAMRSDQRAYLSWLEYNSTRKLRLIRAALVVAMPVACIYAVSTLWYVFSDHNVSKDPTVAVAMVTSIIPLVIMVVDYGVSVIGYITNILNNRSATVV